MNNKDLASQEGFTLIELLFAIALSALFLPAMVFVFSFSLGSASQGESYTQAYAIAQEQMEAVYLLKNDWDWASTSLNTATGSFYQPTLDASNEWQLGTQTSSTIENEDGYAVTVEISGVSRVDNDGDGIEDIESVSNTIVSDTREVTVNVSWNEKGEDTSIELVSYVTRH